MDKVGECIHDVCFSSKRNNFGFVLDVLNVSCNGTKKLMKVAREWNVSHSGQFKTKVLSRNCFASWNNLDHAILFWRRPFWFVSAAWLLWPQNYVLSFAIAQKNKQQQFSFSFFGHWHFSVKITSWSYKKKNVIGNYKLSGKGCSRLYS